MASCKILAEKYKFVINTEEMNEIFECVGEKYRQEIEKLRSDIRAYQTQVSNLLKEKK